MAKGNALNLDTIGQSANRNNPTNIPVGSAARSVSFWAYISSYLTYNIFFLYGPYLNWFGIYLSPIDGYTRVDFWGNYNDWNVAFGTGAWHHMVVTFDGSAKSVIYYDGDPKSTRTDHPAVNTVDGYLVIGNDINSGSPYTPKFLIDELQVYDKELSSVEVTALFNAGAGVYGSAGANLVAAWHFDEATGVDPVDYSGSGNTLTLTGSPTEVEGWIDLPAVGNIKKVAGVAWGDIKKIGGVDKANVKKVGGVTA